MSKQDIYQTLIQSGMTREAALGMMGNMMCESGLEANRVQGDFSSFRTVSKAYTQRVTNGSMSRDQFAKDALGYGLVQWTYYSRKYALYDFWKQSGKALDDAEMQTKFAVAELKQDYHALWQTLITCNDLYTCTKLICEQYERPAHNNIDQRFTAAVSLKAELSSVEDKTPEKPSSTYDTYWPPRMICQGMSGPDVSVLQALLTAHGLECEITGIFDTKTHNMTIAYQSKNGLAQDGIAGPKTWGKLLER